MTIGHYRIRAATHMALSYHILPSNRFMTPELTWDCETYVAALESQNNTYVVQKHPPTNGLVVSTVRVASQVSVPRFEVMQGLWDAESILRQIQVMFESEFDRLESELSGSIRTPNHHIVYMPVDGINIYNHINPVQDTMSYQAEVELGVVACTDIPDGVTKMSAPPFSTIEDLTYNIDLSTVVADRDRVQIVTTGIRRVLDRSLFSSTGMASNMWSCYILRCSDGSLYTGITTDLVRRVDQHNGLEPGGAKYTSSRRPVSLVMSWLHRSRSSASKQEAFIKSLTRVQKKRFVTTGRTWATRFDLLLS